MRVAVVGHVEWVEFVRVPRVPASGEIVHATETWSQAGGGGAVAALQLARLSGAATLLTALGGDELGARARTELERSGVHVVAAARGEPQRRAVTFVDESGERTITLLSPKLVPRRDDPLPWEQLAKVDAVYFTGGDAGALRAARGARVLVATARELPTLVAGAVALDALVLSGTDEGERYAPRDLKPTPRLVVTTEGEKGGTYALAEGGAGAYPAAPLPGPLVDTYGAGDCFAAGLAFGLANALPLLDALALGARCGAAAMTGRGVHVGAA